MVLYPRNPATEPIPDLTIYEALFENGSSPEEEDLIIYADVESERCLSLSGLREKVLKMGGLLKQEYQWEAGDVLAVCAYNNVGLKISVEIRECSFSTSRWITPSPCLRLTPLVRAIFSSSLYCDIC